MRVLPAIAALLLTVSVAYAQSARLKGRVLEGGLDRGLQAANVFARSLEDSTRSSGTVTNRAGFFELDLGWSGPTFVRISHVGFHAFEDTVEAAGDIDFGVVTLESDVLDLEGVEISARRERMVIKGDTVEYLARGFFVPRYTSAESLVEAIPGFSIEGGVVMYMGHPIDRVLIDGRAYFGAEVMEALQMMPIEMIEALQVYEQLPEERQFSGVDDGSREQVINLVTDPQKRRATTIHVGGTGGTADRYGAESGVTYMHAPLNLRAQLSSENVSRQSSGGLSRTHQGNVRYSNTWKENTRLNATYTFNDRLNESLTELSRDYLSDVGGFSTYDEARTSNSNSRSHTVSGSLRHTFREAYRISFNPRLLLLDATASGARNALTTDPVTQRSRPLQTGSTSENGSVTGGFSSDFQLGGDRKYGVTASLNMSFSDDTGESFQTSSFDAASSGLITNSSETANSTWSLDAALSAMRQVGEGGFVSFSLDHRSGLREEDLLTLSDQNGSGLVLDSTLSNDYQGRTYSSGAMGHAGIVRNRRELRTTVGVRRQSRSYQERFPVVERVYSEDYALNVDMGGALPIRENSKVTLNYSVNASTPDAEDLKRVVDYSNPLFLSVGNPDIGTRFSHSLQSKVNLRQTVGPTLAASLRATVRPNTVGNETWYAGPEPREVLGILIPAGGQLTRQAHLGTSQETTLSVTVVDRFESLHGTSVTLSLNARSSRRPVSIDEEVLDSRSSNLDGSVSLRGQPIEGSFVNATYKIDRSRVESGVPSPASDYVSHTGTGQFALFHRQKGLSISAQFSASLIRRQAAPADTRSSNLGVSFGYRPPKFEQLVAHVAANNLFDSGNRISQTHTEFYVENRRVDRLGRHLMFSLRWQLRNFRPDR